MDIHRYEYTKGRLFESEIPDNPMDLLKQWLEEAVVAGVTEPTAMCLSTVDTDGRPSARMVLLRGISSAGLRFFTNYHSRKGAEIESNAKVALTFWWGPMERQIRIEGQAVKISAEESDLYFYSRPIDSQIASAVSPQSQSLSSSSQIDEMFNAAKKEWGDSVTRPEHWGGYDVTISRIEFWQGRPSRLHDRIVFEATENGFLRSRLAP